MNNKFIILRQTQGPSVSFAFHILRDDETWREVQISKCETCGEESCKTTIIERDGEAVCKFHGTFMDECNDIREARKTVGRLYTIQEIMES